jgi:hypothetical protein
MRRAGLLEFGSHNHQPALGRSGAAGFPALQTARVTDSPTDATHTGRQSPLSAHGRIKSKTSPLRRS